MRPWPTDAIGDPFSRQPQPLDDASQAWLEGLSASGARRAETLAELHTVDAQWSTLPLQARRHWADQFREGQCEDIAHEATESAVLAVINPLHEYRGESQFTS